MGGGDGGGGVGKAGGGDGGGSGGAFGGGDGADQVVLTVVHEDEKQFQILDSTLKGGF